MTDFTTTIPYIASEIESHKNVYRSQSKSKVTRQRSTAGQLYAFSLNFRSLTKAEAFPIIAYFENEAGNTFTLLHPDHKTPMGGASGSPLVNGASQTGKELITDAWPFSTTVLKAGDIFSIGTNGSKVYRVTEDVVSDGSGNATIKLFPDLVSSPADGAAVNYTGVLFSVVMKDKIQKYQSNHNNIFTYEIPLIESL